MSLATTRDRRSNAGSRMNRLLENEEEDDFYKSTYGGFEEEAEDNDYEEEDSGSDDVDSDFDIDENDQLRSDVEDEGNEPMRKKRRLVTKSYKEPKKSEKTEKSADEKPKEKKVRQPKVSSVQFYHSPEKKSLRQSTAQKSKMAAEKELEREERNKMMKEIAARRNVSEVRRLTQEELLEEAKHTERINLKSLEMYQRLELEKKRARVQKQVNKGPMIRYYSVTMPLIQELPLEAEVDVDRISPPLPEAPAPPRRSVLRNAEKCSRTFITFTDGKAVDAIFPQKRPQPIAPPICPVTKLPAKYYDPMTQLPYRDIQAFKLIRLAYQRLAKSAEQAPKKQPAEEAVK